MPATATPAGFAAPASPAVELPTRHYVDEHGAATEVRALRLRPDLVGVQLTLSALGIVCSRVMHPEEARELAVYLVDCANALDNPAARVIVDEGEGVGHE